jgi:uncharacterized protein YecE (DUF72 family)
MAAKPARTKVLARSTTAKGSSGPATVRSKAGFLRVGTSGWHYLPWRGLFYAEDAKPKDFLSYYVTRFTTTELNNPFYRAPTDKAVVAWREATADHFLFAWKVSRLITHMKRLKGVDENVEFLEARARNLGPKLGPFLVQLPPSLSIDRDRLGAFLTILPKHRRFAFEFRHPSWYEPAILDLLRDHDCALCLSDHAAAPSPFVATASFVYVRGHGPGGRYAGNYSDETLREWAASTARWRAEGRDVYVYFDNDIKTAAPADADRLLALTAATATTAIARAPAKSA